MYCTVIVELYYSSRLGEGKTGWRGAKVDREDKALLVVTDRAAEMRTANTEILVRFLVQAKTLSNKPFLRLVHERYSLYSSFTKESLWWTLREDFHTHNKYFYIV